eukprot:356346-Chlamydomonas_euryale.AAC.5
MVALVAVARRHWHDALCTVALVAVARRHWHGALRRVAPHCGSRVEAGCTRWRIQVHVCQTLKSHARRLTRTHACQPCEAIRRGPTFASHARPYHADPRLPAMRGHTTRSEPLSATRGDTTRSEPVSAMQVHSTRSEPMSAMRGHMTRSEPMSATTCKAMRDGACNTREATHASHAGQDVNRAPVVPARQLQSHFRPEMHASRACHCVPICISPMVG